MNNLNTLSQLLAIAMGSRCEGPHRCCLCGSPASQPYQLPDSFTTRDILANPRGAHICAGCVLAMHEAGEAVYPDGVRYQFTKSFRRMLSHVVTPTSVVMATKGHMEYLRNVCTNPPDPPFAISLAVSGQKHVLFRGRVCHSRDSIVVTLEGEAIHYRPAELIERLQLCGRTVSATGKPALSDPPSASFWFRVCDRFDQGESYCSEWERVREEPLSRFAAFLSLSKEGAEREYPSDRHGGVPSPGGGIDRPEPPANGRGRKREHQRRSQATLFGDV